MSESVEPSFGADPDAPVVIAVRTGGPITSPFPTDIGRCVECDHDVIVSHATRTYLETHPQARLTCTVCALPRLRETLEGGAEGLEVGFIPGSEGLIAEHAMEELAAGIIETAREDPEAMLRLLSGIEAFHAHFQGDLSVSTEEQSEEESDSDHLSSARATLNALREEFTNPDTHDIDFSGLISSLGNHRELSETLRGHAYDELNETDALIFGLILVLWRAVAGGDITPLVELSNVFMRPEHTQAAQVLLCMMLAFLARQIHDLQRAWDATEDNPEGRQAIGQVIYGVSRFAGRHAETLNEMLDYFLKHKGWDPDHPLIDISRLANLTYQEAFHMSDDDMAIMRDDPPEIDTETTD